MTLKAILTATAVALTAAAAMPAAAAPIIYTGTQVQNVGPTTITANYSITTNGVLGSDLDASNITAFEISLSDPISTYFFGNLTSGVRYEGTFDATSTALTATRDGIMFAVFDDPQSPGEIGFFGDVVYARIDDRISYNFDMDATIATAAPAGAVPEPATWAMMIVGFGAVGASLRARRRTFRVRFA